MKTLSRIITAGLALIATSCIQPTEWHDPKDEVAPGALRNIEIEELSGGARITYRLPDDDDLLGAKASFSYSEGGATVERFASAGNDTIELEGFGDTLTHAVTLYAIDKSGNVSAGETRTFKPLTPPIALMRETLEVSGEFGGIGFKWDNPNAKDMGVSLYVPDSISGEMLLHDTQYSNSVEGYAVFRTFDAVVQSFRLEMFDRWNNYAVPLTDTITPLKEVELVGRIPGEVVGTYINIWKLFDDDNLHWQWRGDMHNGTSSTYVGRKFELVFDGNIPSGSVEGTYWHTAEGVTYTDYFPGETGAVPFPLYFTVDMGRPAKYSRFNIHSRTRSPTYSAPLPIDFEIWATNSPKLVTEVGDGSREANLRYWTNWEDAGGTDAWKEDGWVKLTECKLTLSSGESKYVAGMAISAEDIEKYGLKGFDFGITEDVAEGYRYLRWIIHDTNTGAKGVTITEIQFWGIYTDE
ncbi:MAG: DUF4959 domain-containing protein [Bacteroidales bacterium]|jgi:hypothetical protein|nr:DUF4959 domain-containing protein [Bacteroidales bacterium]